jgi:uncharacterized protein YjiS (DUF1127 family)
MRTMNQDTSGPGRALWSWTAIPVTLRRLRSALWTAVVEWHRRAESRRALSELDDRMLRDIGVQREQMEREIRKPFWQP